MSNQPWQQRPDGLTIISIWFYLCGAFFLVITVVIAFVTLILGLNAVAADHSIFLAGAVFALITLALMALSILNLVVGYGIWILKPWARIGAIALSMVSLIFMPIGTVAGALILAYLLIPSVAAVFERPAIDI